MAQANGKDLNKQNIANIHKTLWQSIIYTTKQNIFYS